VYAADELKEDPIVLKNIIEIDEWALAEASPTLKNSKDLVWRAIEISNTSGAIFALASDTLRADPEFCLKVLQKDGDAMPFVDPSLRRDERFIRFALVITNVRQKVIDGALVSNPVKEEMKRQLQKVKSVIDGLDGHVTANIFEPFDIMQTLTGRISRVLLQESVKSLRR
jgi:hypothetical protein